MQGVGIVATHAIVLTALILFLFLRARKRMAKVCPSNTNIISDKLELEGEPVDKGIVGPVKAKSELPTASVVIDTQSRQSNTTLLPFKPSLGPLIDEPGVRIRSVWSPAELPNGTEVCRSVPSKRQVVKNFFVGAHPLRHRGLPDSALRSPGPDGALREEKGKKRRSSLAGSGSSSTVGERPSLSPTPAELEDASSAKAAELAIEADLLVQELGLIGMRKKALSNLAAAQGLLPEDLGGAKGEDFRELLRREEKLRRRMEGSGFVV